MIKSAIIKSVVAGVFACAQAASAWGVLGHQVVASLAEDMLTPKAKAEAASLLGHPGASGTLAGAATWADDIRILRPETRPWHYVTIQIGEPRYDSARADTPNVVGALKNSLRTLRRAEADRYAREEALKWTIHLVGDLHQPLHTGEDHDKGGNLVKVKVGRRTYNLHAVWDYVLLERLHEPLDTLRALLAAEIAADPGFIARNAKGTVEDWVNETHAKSAACYRVHGKLIRKDIKTSLERDYVRPNTLVVLDQLKLAAVRLAFVLNAALDPAAPRVPAPPHAALPAPGADRAPFFAHNEELPATESARPGYFWSANSKVYHLAGCADIARIKRKNLRSGDAPPPLMELHKGCPVSR